jgi:hypothetical protein
MFLTEVKAYATIGEFHSVAELLFLNSGDRCVICNKSNGFEISCIFNNMKSVKLVTIAGILAAVGFIANSSQRFEASAKDDDVFNEIAKYKSWKQVTKIDEKKETGAFTVFDSSATG